jgi:hypothetical protein
MGRFSHSGINLAEYSGLAADRDDEFFALTMACKGVVREFNSNPIVGYFHVAIASPAP